MSKLYFDMDKCPGCDKKFDSKLTKTKHHVVPLFLKPKNEVLVPLCKKCHEEINNSYVHINLKTKKTNGTFAQFYDRYEKLRTQFKAGKINRGVFGEGLWDNNVNLLRDFDERVTKLEGQNVE